MSVSRFGRVNQWLTMARQWHVVDAKSQLRQVQSVPKRSDEYTAEERKAFPKLFEFDEEFVMDWTEPIEPHGRYVPEQPKK
ncbi:hypothetical protein QR680_010568 [Steinernema hermaphroditum]|uniref:Uncharacterized protein n=1 Tax=Steinernema hermaphroditum TaxID=289476 RepID=A0AA39IPG4_9BILA|nr:hypothetical protein QR680_010568 [Steinernema hermaphroditum]